METFLVMKQSLLRMNYHMEPLKWGIYFPIYEFIQKPIPKRTYTNIKHLIIDQNTLYFIDSKEMQNYYFIKVFIQEKSNLTNDNCIVIKTTLQNIKKIYFELNPQEKIFSDKFYIRIKLQSGNKFLITILGQFFWELKHLILKSEVPSNLEKVSCLRFEKKFQKCLELVDTIENIVNLFRLVVVENQMISAETFVKIVFLKNNLFFILCVENDDHIENFNFLSQRIINRIKSKSFKVDFVIPELWGNPNRFHLMNESKMDHKQIVHVPFFEKVKISRKIILRIKWKERI